MTAPGRYAKGEVKRQEILEVALSLIADHGYRRSTLREIATAVGLTNAGVLHYFASREELFAEVLRLRDATPAPTSTDEGRLGEFVAAISANADVPGLVQLYVSLSAEATDPDHGARDFFEERFDRVERMLVRRIQEGIERGEIRRGVDAERLARVLIAVADGIQTQWLIRPAVDMADHVTYVLSLVAVDDRDGDPKRIS